ncbi:MAG: KEOPS complex subunit Pcc1 [Candidatus Helarchaeota archaeon]
MENIRADITINCNNEIIAKNFFDSLYPETKAGLTDRSAISITRKNTILKFFITAKDITAFRATLNSYLIWTRTLFAISEIENER